MLGVGDQLKWWISYQRDSGGISLFPRWVPKLPYRFANIPVRSSLTNVIQKLWVAQFHSSIHVIALFQYHMGMHNWLFWLANLDCNGRGLDPMRLTLECDFTWAGVHTDLWSRCSKLFSGWTTVEKFGRKFTCVTFCRRGAWITAWIFSCVLCKSFVSISWPQNLILSWKKAHFFVWALNPYSCSLFNTICRFCRCSSSVFPVITMSSRIHLVPGMPSRTCSIRSLPDCWGRCNTKQ